MNLEVIIKAKKGNYRISFFRKALLFMLEDSQDESLQGGACLTRCLLFVINVF